MFFQLIAAAVEERRGEKRREEKRREEERRGEQLVKAMGWAL